MIESAVETVGERRGGGLVDDALDLESVEGRRVTAVPLVVSVVDQRVEPSMNGPRLISLAADGGISGPRAAVLQATTS